jgi:hypothetical protein
MRGLVPRIHVLVRKKDVDGRDKPGQDEPKPSHLSVKLSTGTDTSIDLRQRALNCRILMAASVERQDAQNSMLRKIPLQSHFGGW